VFRSSAIRMLTAAADVANANVFFISTVNKLVWPTPIAAIAVCAEVRIARTRTPLSPYQKCRVSM
jgi:hypothetical protein